MIIAIGRLLILETTPILNEALYLQQPQPCRACQAAPCRFQDQANGQDGRAWYSSGVPFQICWYAVFPLSLEAAMK